MKVTTGIDIIEVDRIKKSIEELGQHFLDRIYTDEEIKYCSKSEIVKYQHFAGRFAAKEAVIKALSDNIKSKEDIIWKEIEILNDEEGKPKININNLKSYNLEKIENIDISISHIKDYAVASVVAVFK